MSAPRIHVDQRLSAGEGCTLPVTAANHLRAFRLRPGDPLVLFNGEGGEYPARLEALARREAQVTVLAHDPVERESPLTLTLVQGIARGERMDFTVQKAVELGVSRILPVFTDKGVVKLDSKRQDKRQQHWQRVAVAACEQCGRNRVPEVAAPQPLADAWSGLDTAGQGLVLAPGGRSLQALARQQSHLKAAWLLIGPEGGLSEAEVEKAVGQGAEAVGLGPRILRTETAGITALAALQLLHGDLAG
ncbi:16S rRNA (uracil1498-N3)-methyltransferase [Alkalispirillum mobile]|uniref:Ribosomal RNA small subunit methyltransferase E n=1 Tax=Alkalispirillum mobile TaxID=85925 RepID=A0A498CA78_9GAMM|nr:16S rRNA (uracil(1498)-N(3))-methyltransferase [Alkalispirillum mobile]RLK51386.1 16S rRNA (uracil1498-N3)-methyltransferase [Alkalispirillum mobile]